MARMINVELWISPDVRVINVESQRKDFESVMIKVILNDFVFLFHQE